MGAPSLARVVFSSLLVPGSGQWLQGQKRWAAYLTVEAAALLFTLERRRSGGSFRDSYRDLAWTAARAGTAVGRIDPDFAYYERLAAYRSSGSFDADPVMFGVQPEVDPVTYNGRIWELARGIFLGGVAEPTPDDPGYAQALNYYLERSYDDRFLWDWEGRTGEQIEYRSLISKSDEAFRTATVLLGVGVANHLVSAIDAFLSSRARSSRLSERLEFGALPQRVPGASGATQWDVHMRVRW